MRRFITVMLALSMLYLSGCTEDFNLTNYEIQGISKQHYIGLQSDSIKPNPLPKEITILEANSNTPIYLNGSPINQYIKDSTIQTDKIQDFLRQGVNQLMVAPLSFGPSLNFSFDNEGPLIDVHDVEKVGNASNVTLKLQDASNVTSVILEEYNYQFDGGVDTSQYKNFKTSTQSGTGIYHNFTKDSDGLWRSSSSINHKPMYKITATDTHGYITEQYYLSPNEKINNVFKLRLNKKILDTVVPMGEAAVSYAHLYAPKAMTNMGKSHPTNPDAEPSEMLDTMAKFWSKEGIFYGESGAHTKNSNNCGYIETKNWDDEDVYFNCAGWDGDDCKGGEWVIPSNIDYKSGHCSKVIMYDTELGLASDLKFSLKDGNGKEGIIDLNIKLNKGTKDKALKANLGIKNVQCGKISYKKGGFLGIGAKTYYYTDNYCRISSDVSYIGVGMGDLKVSADTGNPSGEVKVLIQDGDLKFDLPSTKLNLSGLKIGSGLDGIIGLLSGLLDGMFVDIVKNVIKQNMPEFILGADMFLPWDDGKQDSSLRVQSHAYQVWTNADNDPNNALEWYMYYAGFLKPLKNHPDLDAHVLGSRYEVEEMLLPEVTGADIDLAININIINQALMAFYQSGISHITMLTNKHWDEFHEKESQVFFGPNVTSDFNFSNKEKRIQLIPRSPGTIQMKNTTHEEMTQASLYYRNARMLIETFNGSSWDENFDVEVNMKIGVVMKAQNDKFYITVLGVPELEINEIKMNGSSNYVYSSENETLNMSFNNNAVKGIVQGLVNTFLSITIPEITQEMLEFEYPGIPIPETSNGIFMKTKSISANAGKHLSFGLAMDTEPCVLNNSEDNVCD